MSHGGACYFITMCARRPEHKLISATCASAINAAVARCENDGDWTPMAITIMPDHLHVLATVSGRLTLGQVIGKLKVFTRVALKSEGVLWQENFHEHRLRPSDIPGDYARYIFLNPYRARLIARSHRWPFWSKAADVDFGFVSMLDSGLYPPEEWVAADIALLGVSADAVGAD